MKKVKWSFLILITLITVLFSVGGCSKDEDKKSSDSNLKSLSVSTTSGNALEIVPLFSPDVLSYSLNAPETISEVLVSAETSSNKATISGIGKYNLIEGENIIRLLVTAEDKEGKKEFTIKVNKENPNVKNSYLKTLSINSKGIAVAITPMFSSTATEYTAVVENDIQTITLSCEAENIKAVIDGAGEKNLIEGDNNFVIKVTSENKSLVKEYKIKITRKAKQVFTQTIIYFEKPGEWSGVSLRTKVDEATSFVAGPMTSYRPDWYKSEVKIEYKKFEFNFANGTNKIDNGGKNYIIKGPGEYWITRFGELVSKDPYNPGAEGIKFNSRDTKYKSPFGAVPAGKEIKYSFESNKDVLTEANLIIEKQLVEGDRKISYSKFDSIKMSKTTSNDKDVWEVKHSFSDKGVYGYYFEVINSSGKRYLAGSGDRMLVAHYNLPKTGGDGLVFLGVPKEGEFIQTIYDPAFKTPDWAKDTVFYYIFPERFRNGSKTNDPKIGVDKFYGNKDIELHKNWLDPKPFVPSDGSDKEYCNDFYGGDIAGMTEKLDYMKELGINTIYTNPIFEAPSNHKYDTADYMKIDNNFGNLDDFKKLVSEAEKRGIRVLLDTSLNHSGSDSVYMDRYSKYDGTGAFENEKIQTDSPYYDWFLFNPNASTADGKYNQWANPTLATLNPNSQSYRDFAFRKDDSVTKYWLGQGSSGWRMDVVPWKPDDFWKEWRTNVKAKKGDALTVAECWFDSSKYFLGDMFDSTMNYIFRQAVYGFASGLKSAKESNEMLEVMRENYPMESFYVLMNLLSTHDAPRALFYFGYKEAGSGEYDSAKSKLKLAILFQMTYPGAPAIYYGDEVGMTGAEDPYNRGPYPWEDEGGKPDKTLFQDIKTMVKMRNDNAILRRGTLEPIYSDENVVAYIRSYEGKNALVVLNNSSSAKTVKIDLAGKIPDGTYSDLLGAGNLEISNSKVEISVNPLWGKVIVK